MQTKKSIHLDLRHLEPPEPLRVALEAASRLERGQTLTALTRFRPVHLFEQLQAMELEWEDEEAAEGHWVTTCWHQPLH